MNKRANQIDAANCYITKSIDHPTNKKKQTLSYS